MELVLVRHALPVRVDGSAHGGPADPELAAHGVRQAERLVPALALDEVDAVYSSPAARARATAQPLLAARGLELAVEPGLAEFDAAAGSYVPVEELRAADDPRWHALVQGGLPPEVDPVAFRRGVVAAVEAVIAAHPGGRAVAFTHSGTINAYAGHVLGRQRALWFAPAYGSITRIGAARNGRRGVVSLNETGHLRDLLPLR